MANQGMNPVMYGPAPHRSTTFKPEDIPQEIVRGPYSKIGHFIKQCIVYFHRQCVQMNTLIWEPLRQTMNMLPNDNADLFWNREEEMKDQTAYLGAFMHFILKGCEIMHERHVSQGNQRVYLNLERRCIFQLAMCLRVLMDTRLMSDADEFYLLGNEQGAEPEHMQARTQKIIPSLGWISGLNETMIRERIARTLVRVSLPDYYPESTNQFRVRLPPQFVRILQTIYGDTFRIPASHMRKCLTYYALYLVHIIWKPRDFGEQLFRAYYDHQTVFSTNLTADQIVQGWLPDPGSIQTPNWIYSFSNVLDSTTLNSGTWRYTQHMDGVHLPDNEDYERSSPQFDFLKFCEHIYQRDLLFYAVGHTLQGIWRSVIH